MIFSQNESEEGRPTGGTRERQRLMIIPPEGGESWWVATDHQLMKLTGEQTGGAFSLWIETVPPGGGPPPHRHGREDECFVVLEGEVAFSAEGASSERVAGPGAVVYAPRGGFHAFRNPGKVPARMLVLLTPAGFEGFFREVGVRSPSRVARPPVERAEIDAMLGAAERYGLEFAPPPAG